MRAGQLRDRVDVLQRVETVSDSGAVKEEWTTLKKRYAHIEPLRETEQTDASSIEGRRSHRVTVRHDGELTPDLRFRFRGRIFHIDAVLTDQLRREDKCLCVEMTP